MPIISIILSEDEFEALRLFSEKEL